MNILVLNAGSSSLKYQLIAMPSQEVKCVGLVERIGMEDAIFTHEKGSQEHNEVTPILDHTAALKKVESALMDSNYGVLKNVDEIDAVGHRVVHGGSQFTKTVLATPDVKENIKELFALAPLHNPANLTGIEVAENVFSNAKQAVIFDTAFHQTMPREAYQYAIANKYLEEDGIRAYGFHGTSHKYVSEKAIEHLKKEKSNIITIHLGNGCSISAVKDGKCIEHSMGMGPSNGLVMGTRAGDIDQSVVFHMQKKLGKTADEVNHILQKESGMKGLTGHSDLRDIRNLAAEGNQDCINALNLAAHRIKKFIGSYTAILNGLDAIVFTAGIGENSSLMRELSCKNMSYLGIDLDLDKNAVRSKKIREIQKQDANVKILIVPTNEELEIAKQTYELIC
ncbi:acetate/propionate family kinase [Flavicella marina]|uniref:acetate/propionate family kinase n=1 Tax=Flavicella marina TaxID=1475951 RepID=UPI001264577B|nr:acetate kinase [Flavicella marina]